MGESAQQSSIEQKALETTEELNRIAANLHTLIVHSEDGVSLRLLQAAQDIGRIARGSEASMGIEYGMD